MNFIGNFHNVQDNEYAYSFRHSELFSNRALPRTQVMVFTADAFDRFYYNIIRW